MNVLEDLFYGNITPSEKCFEPKSQYGNLVKVISDNEEKLMSFFSALPNAEEEQHLLSQLLNAQSELNQFSEIERFIEGFRLGARFMLDTFVMPDNSVIRDIT